jgi:hypothetical protein
VDAGGRPRKCKRQVIRRCRQRGLGTCAPPGTRYVAPAGSDTAGCGTQASPCRNIQYVIDQLVPVGGSATIKAAAGTYDGLSSCPVGTAPNQAVACILNRQVTLLGGFVPPDWDNPNGDPASTVIDGKGLGRGVRVQRTNATAPSASLEMDGFTILNGLAQGMSQGDINQTYTFGGGMFSEDSTLTLRNVVFRANRAVGGTTNQSEGGRGSGGALAVSVYTPSASAPVASLQNVTFDGNQAHGGDGVDRGGYALGGALFTFGVALAGDTLVFQNNTAVAGSSNGSGTSGPETSDGLGGAVCVEMNSSADLRHVRATGNTATGGNAPNGEAGGAFGGGFFAELGTLTLTDAVVEQNLALGGDGRDPTGRGSLSEGGAIHTTRSALTLDRVVVVQNQARSGNGAMVGGAAGGGGVAVTFGSGSGVDLPFTIRNSVIADNLVALGTGTLAGGGAGGLWIQGAVGTIEFTTIANNVLGDSHLFGGGIAVLDVSGWQTHATVRDSILANHTNPGVDPTSYGNAALYVAQNTTADVTTVLFANNLHDTNAGVSGGYNLPPGTVNMTGVLTAPDARFVAAGSPGEDYHLTVGSPAVDQATGTSVTVDLDGNARPSGAASDVGAYELLP